jgi:hypothetical protein
MEKEQKQPKRIEKEGNGSFISFFPCLFLFSLPAFVLAESLFHRLIAIAKVSGRNGF